MDSQTESRSFSALGSPCLLVSSNNPYYPCTMLCGACAYIFEVFCFRERPLLLQAIPYQVNADYHPRQRHTPAPTL